MFLPGTRAFPVGNSYMPKQLSVPATAVNAFLHPSKIRDSEGQNLASPVCFSESRRRCAPWSTTSGTGTMSAASICPQRVRKSKHCQLFFAAHGCDRSNADTMLRPSADRLRCTGS